jgi:hypothetical protein
MAGLKALQTECLMRAEVPEPGDDPSRFGLASLKQVLAAVGAHARNELLHAKVASNNSQAVLAKHLRQVEAGIAAGFDVRHKKSALAPTRALTPATPSQAQPPPSAKQSQPPPNGKLVVQAL